MADEDRLSRNEVRAKIAAAYGGLLVPVAIVGATLWFNHSNAQIAARQKCIDQSLEIVRTYSAQTVSPTRGDERRRFVAMLATLGDLTVQSCRRARLDIPPFVSATLRQAEREAAGTPAAAVLGGVAERAEEQSGEEAPSAAQTLAPSQPGAIRLFIHISEESQREAAQRLELALEAAQLGGSAIVVPGIELVPGGGDNSLRCLKRADCRRAEALTGLIGRTLSAPAVTPRDLSARYERDRGVAAGTYELWFGPGEIRFAGE